MRLFFNQGNMLVFVKWVIIISYDVSLFESILGWTYHYSNNTMTWNKAENYCQTYFTNLMVIQNLAENHNLTENLPQKDKYYWIGLRKVNSSWTWTGTNETLQHESWAINEPNNVKDNEDCVELYVNQGNNRGKWNDEKCNSPKYALCYKAQCDATTCQGRGKCHETFNNYSCTCDPGFTGQHCEHAVACSVSGKPLDGTMTSSNPQENVSVQSSCNFSCLECFNMEGSPEITCNSSGVLNTEEPFCKVECKLCSHDDYTVNCSGGTWNWTCAFRCSKGVLLLGPNKMTCNSEGIWTGQRPVCIDYKTFAMAVAGAGLLSCSCFIFFCFMHHRKRRQKIIQSRTEDEGSVQPQSQT
ncbi:L-selectin isoform X2 [Scleropages formosus]|uniref:L-selectin isoform X2 n=1 Tax=Scleropages formosus TaxID=113540 RepID=UPI000877ED40|nr:L-selectin isoform X2 [Scleropages formosus]